MARYQSEQGQWSHIKYSDLQKPVIFVVDMICGFLEEGALHDTAIQTCIPAIKALLEQKDARVIFIADAHEETAKEFQSYPIHCKKGTKESEIVAALQPYSKEIFYKNSTNTFMAEAFQTFLREEFSHYQDIVICGCCSDICIMQFALSLQTYCNEHDLMEKRIIVAMDTVDTYHIEGVHDVQEWNDIAFRTMQANGICVVNTIES